MKKMISAFILTISIFMATTSNSKAGVILLATSGGAAGPVIGGIASIAAGTIGVIAGPSLVIASFGFFAEEGTLITLLGVAFLVLDIDGNLTEDSLVSLLNQKYPFIDNEEVVRELASVIKSKSELIEANSQGEKYVTLTDLELQNATFAANLSPDQYAILVNDLTK